MVTNPESQKPIEQINHNNRFEENPEKLLGGFWKMLDGLFDRKTEEWKKQFAFTMADASNIINSPNQNWEDSTTANTRKRRELKDIYNSKSPEKIDDQWKFDENLKSSIDAHAQERVAAWIEQSKRSPDGGQCEAAKPGPKKDPPFPL